MVTGCVKQRPVVDPTSAAAQLSTGAPLLRCRADCVAEWRAAQPRAAQLDAAARWGELAALVITINYRDDLTLYYLARAAEGLGYLAAADSYYRQSTYISGTSQSCRHASGVCGGVVLPDAALARIDALESEANRSRPQPPRRRATGAKPAPAGSKPIAEPQPQPLAPMQQRQQPEETEPKPQQPTAPEPQPPAAAPTPQSNLPSASERSDAVREPPPATQPASPQPTRVDPIAKQYIEPPAGR
jgi:hypothetical protein